jgi:hypothetical protein
LNTTNLLLLLWYPIYCINLEHRNDRKIHSINEFSKINIHYKNVKYLSFTKDNRGGVYGCYDSHMKVWNDFYYNYPNNKFCLVFEDDFKFLICKEEFHNWLISLFSSQQNVDFKVVMLAYNALQNEPYSDILHKSNNAQTTAGFIVKV